MPRPLVYLDSAATSWPKPDTVAQAVLHCLRDVGANPGRSAHRLALDAERIRFDARLAVAELFGAPDPHRVVFTANATTALNLVLRGMLRTGDHVVTTGMEHNAALRPLRALQAEGVSVSIAPGDADGYVDHGAVAERLRPQTRLVVATHASNVNGIVLPIRAYAAAAHAHGVPLLIDAAQTGGCWPLDVIGDGVDLLAFSGHKGLLGPAGVGGLVLHPDFEPDRLAPLVRGGTGSRSEHELQPDFLPDKYEAGTPNTPGLAGLVAGVQYVLERSVADIRAHERALMLRLLAGLREVRGVCTCGPADPDRCTAVVSLTADSLSPAELAQQLDERFDILCRPGLHCAPQAHRTLRTFPAGTVRLAPGPFTTPEDIDRTVAAVAEIVRGQPRAQE